MIVPAVVTLFRDVEPSTSSPQIHLAWKFVSSLCAVERYQIEYEQTYCQAPTSQRVEVTTGTGFVRHSSFDSNCWFAP